jgi:hypothetical protein
MPKLLGFIGQQGEVKLVVAMTLQAPSTPGVSVIIVLFTSR